MRILLLAASLVLAGCGGVKLGGSRVDSSLAALVPADAIILTGVRLADLRGTALYKKLEAENRLGGLDDVTRGANFDPRKDVDELLLAYDGRETVALARGRFEPRPPDGATRSDYKGVTIYSQSEGAYAVLDSAIAAAGPLTAVRKAIDRKQGGGAGPEALLARARDAASGGQIWFVANGWGNLPGRAAAEGGNLGNLTRVINSIQSATGSVEVASGVATKFEARWAAEPDAKTLADSLRGMVGLARLTVPRDQPDLQKVYDRIRVEQQQQNVRVAAEIPPALLDTLLAAAPARR
jgi:hypothetical protein